ncbi:hypothetical protein HWV62_24350 [Athelia sp. TMB]|nr:hypothetical protein HWV62_24350 [Athelia sp. TMB]
MVNVQAWQNLNTGTIPPLGTTPYLPFIPFDHALGDIHAAEKADRDNECFNFGPLVEDNITMSTDWDMLSSSQSDKSPFSAFSDRVNSAQSSVNNIEDELVSSMAALALPAAPGASPRKFRSLRVIVKDEALSLIGAQKVLRGSGRMVHTWILPDTPLRNAFPRFQDGRICHEVNWKHTDDDLTVDFLSAVVKAVRAITESEAIHASDEEVQLAVRAYFNTMRKNYFAQKRGKQGKNLSPSKRRKARENDKELQLRTETGEVQQLFQLEYWSSEDEENET